MSNAQTFTYRNLNTRTERDAARRREKERNAARALKKQHAAFAFDHDAIVIDYDCDATRDDDASVASNELLERLTRYAIAH